jgi:hypothetical protein
MRAKRELTRHQQVVRSYWPYTLSIYEQLFLDVGNLVGTPDTGALPVLQGSVPNPGANDKPDPAACEQIRAKWCEYVREWIEDSDHALLGLRNMIRNALLKDDPSQLQALAIRLANLRALSGPIRRRSSHALLWSDRFSEPSALFPRPTRTTFAIPLAALGHEVKMWEAPLLFDLPRALAAAVLSFTGKGLKLVCCRQCGRCVLGRRNQKFCPGGTCRFAWHQSQPEYKKTRREYMRNKMRFYREHEKRSDRLNRKTMGR